MSIQDLSDEQVENLIQNYRRLDKTEGGKYTLAECLLDNERRKGIAYNGRDVTAKIVELAKASDDGLCTYLELWKSFNPNKEWGLSSMREVMQMMGAAAYFCVRENQPIVTAAVVRTDKRTVSFKAKQNMFYAAQEWGVNTGVDIEAWYQAQLDGTKQQVEN